MTRHAYDAFWRKDHGRRTHHITTMVATFTGAGDALQSHVMDFNRFVRLVVNLPKDSSGCAGFDRNGTCEVARLATHPEMRIMCDLLIMSLVAVQTGGPFSLCVAELCGVRVANKARKFGMRG